MALNWPRVKTYFFQHQSSYTADGGQFFLMFKIFKKFLMFNGGIFFNV